MVMFVKPLKRLLQVEGAGFSLMGKELLVRVAGGCASKFDSSDQHRPSLSSGRSHLISMPLALITAVEERAQQIFHRTLGRANAGAASKHLLLFYVRFTSLLSARILGGELRAHGWAAVHTWMLQPSVGWSVSMPARRRRCGAAEAPEPGLCKGHAQDPEHPFLPSAAFVFCDTRPTRSVKINCESCAKRAVSHGDWSSFPTKINGKLALCTIGPFQTQKIFPDSSNYCLMSKE